MSKKERERTLENIARLRRVERKSPSPELAAVREDLESQLGGTVSRSLSAKLLGVSHTALNNWVEAGGIPAVITKQGRKEVPIPALLELQDEVQRQRKSGRRKLHLLEPIMAEAQIRAERMHPGPLGPSPSRRSDPHRTAELRSLAYHRALAPRLRRPMVDEAQRKLRRWEEEGKIDPRYANAWEKVFALPVAEIRKAIIADDERGRGLRQNSPLAGLLSEPERRKILEQA
jgi:hypothetical protein